jgi:hypothetical protein
MLVPNVPKAQDAVEAMMLKTPRSLGGWPSIHLCLVHPNGAARVTVR